MTSLDRTQSALRFDTISAVPAGQNLYRISPEDARLQISSVTLTLTTDANVANRRVVIRASDGTYSFGDTPAPGDQAESLTCTYYFSPCVLGIDQLTEHSSMWAPLSASLILDEATHFETNIIGIQSGDIISNVIIRYNHAFRIRKKRKTI